MKKISSIKLLTFFPNKYQLTIYEKWKSIGIRCMPVGNYLVFYLPTDDDIRIYRIFYSRRCIENQLFDDIFFK